MNTFQLPVTGRRDRKRTIIGYATIPDDHLTRLNVIGKLWNTQPHNYISHHTTGSPKQYLHRLIYELYCGQIANGLEIDHIDRNPLNNLPSNLRLVTHGSNIVNSSRASSTGVRGVYKSDATGRFYARIGIGGKDIRLGFFDTQEEATQARRQAENKYYPHLIPK